MGRLGLSLLPPVCILCGRLTRQTGNLCLACLQDLPILPYHCPRCAQFLPITPHALAEPVPTCGACLKLAPPFDQTFALFPYDPPITQLIIQLKFQHRLSHAKALGELLIQKIRHEWYSDAHLPDLIIPVPLHPRRLRERGFNQALEIAKPVARALSIPIDAHGTRRIKHTAPQSTLTGSERKQNVSHAFSICRDYTGLNLAVLDDVITTGHTLTALCKMLKAHGASRIDVWCCARRG